MTERTTITQVTQIGVESTPGTAVPATRRLQSINIEPAVKVNVESFRPSWDKYTTVTALGREWVECSMSGDPTYNEMPYMLSGVLTAATPIAGTGSDVGAYTWVFKPSAVNPDAPKNYTVEYGSSVRAERFAFGQITAWNYKVDRTKFTLTGQMMGQNITDPFTITAAVNDVKNIHASAQLTAGSYTIGDGVNTTGAIQYNAIWSDVQAALYAATPSPIAYTVTPGGGPLSIGSPTDFVCTANAPGTKPGWTVTPTGITGGTVSVVQGTAGAGPTTVPLIPIIPSTVDVYYASTLGGLTNSGNKLSRDFSVDFSLDSRFGPLWALNSTNASWAATVETVPKAMVKLMVESDAAGMALLADLRAGTTKYLRVQATGALVVGGGSLHYSFIHDMAVKVKDIGPFRDEQGVYAIEFTFDLVDDATFGGPMQVSIVNALSAL